MLIYDNIEKIEKLEAVIVENLRQADSCDLSRESLMAHWVAYRTDMPSALGALRDLKEIIAREEAGESLDGECAGAI
jgi:hypothetical protein|tara:strand:- start:2363 stop:2593 length:231 start_codon:yes stop_codon:yes gene_type:complete